MPGPGTSWTFGAELKDTKDAKNRQLASNSGYFSLPDFTSSEILPATHCTDSGRANAVLTGPQIVKSFFPSTVLRISPRTSGLANVLLRRPQILKSFFPSTILGISPRTMGRQDKFCPFEMYPWSKVDYFCWAFVLKSSLEAPWLLRP